MGQWSSWRALSWWSEWCLSLNRSESTAAKLFNQSANITAFATHTVISCNDRCEVGLWREWPACGKSERIVFSGNKFRNGIRPATKISLGSRSKPTQTFASYHIASTATKCGRVRFVYCLAHRNHFSHHFECAIIAQSTSCNERPSTAIIAPSEDAFEWINVVGSFPVSSTFPWRGLPAN